MRILTVENETDAKRLRTPAKKVKNPQGVIIEVQAMKRACLDWEQKTGRRSEGLAAPQVGIPLRIVILRKNNDTVPKRFEEVEHPLDFPVDVKETEEYRKWKVTEAAYDPWFVLINPRILKREGEQESVEGCLSVPGSAYKVRRPESALVDWTTPSGKHSGQQGVSGFSAAAFCHECNHLDGILLPDIAIEAYLGQEETAI